MAKTKKQRLTQTCDDLMSLIVRKTGYCQKCGATGDWTQYHAHHIVHRSKSLLLRWDRRNLLNLCKGCHFWIHNSAGVFAEMQLLERNLTPEDLAFLKENKNKSVKYSISDMEAIAERLENQLRGE